MNRWLTIALVTAVIGGLLWFSRSYLDVSPEEIRNWILGFGTLAPILFITLYALRPIILFPASVMSLAGGLAFGALWGTVIIVIGATLSAAIAYLIGGKLGSRLIKVKEGGKTATIQKQMAHNGFVYVLIFRFIPVINFDAISYIAATAGVKFRAFITATFIGIIPGTFAYAFLGSSFVTLNPWQIAAAVAIFLVFMIVPILLRKKTVRQNRPGRRRRECA
ncbi:TVP38/TMEM64 family protein [Salisediminibacterium selenitireducens]|uniref:TVP38/TMEM64 family membrane protein n=1 Tax=Bacillus selenitireducens (strain ATCC 700615 / DSM 15326 / MLS10) TaxID=439292 RepID=D6XXE9_BACIE|nr:TVP38/TMEM64 family protein [Salisediminibacterium selenitireducens]ADH98006.1 SNARE associated Golgi protein-related protein [[Bacillus] selenitireducens MLS10]